MAYRFVLSLSGGVTSWAAGRRLLSYVKPSEVVAVFADTLLEDGDTYRFLVEGARDLGVRLVRLSDGRDIWDVFRDEGMIGRSGADVCSRVLKREPLRRWVVENAPAASLVVGFAWDELDRLERTRARVPFEVLAPLTWRPARSKRDALVMARSRGLNIPALYGQGFGHSNCGGYCVKAGRDQLRKLLRLYPERFAYHEARENELRRVLGNVSAHRYRYAGKTYPMPLERIRTESEGAPELDTLGACGCAW